MNAPGPGTPPVVDAEVPAPSPAPATVEPLFEHAYDGIQEFDNPMPRWWVLIFWATIVFAAVYVLNVVPMVGEGPGWIARYEDEMAAAEKKYAATRAPRPAPSDDALRALAADAGARDAGKAVYMMNCMPCHRADAGGVIGPNLTDDYWIHGGEPGDIHRLIAEGVLDKGMPAWGAILRPEELDQVAGYVLSVHGTNPPEPKAPQGTKR
jgi:cytochrome c oxidase cbb3-type subunit 3